MARPAIMPCPRSGGIRAAGFTLIEVLVVVAIIGIVLTFATLSVNPTGPADRLDTAAHRLNALVGAAKDDAILYGREIGLEITPDGYRFLRLGDDGWRPIVGGDSPLRARKLSQGLVLASVATQQDQPELAPKSRDADENKKNALRPEVFFLSSGELVPFKLALSAAGVDHRFMLAGQASGEVKLERLEARR